jgi:hypothetical protein
VRPHALLGRGAQTRRVEVHAAAAPAAPAAAALAASRRQLLALAAAAAALAPRAAQAKVPAGFVALKDATKGYAFIYPVGWQARASGGDSGSRRCTLYAALCF